MAAAAGSVHVHECDKHMECGRLSHFCKAIHVYSFELE